MIQIEAEEYAELTRLREENARLREAANSIIESIERERQPSGDKVVHARHIRALRSALEVPS